MKDYIKLNNVGLSVEDSRRENDNSMQEETGRFRDKNSAQAYSVSHRKMSLSQLMQETSIAGSSHSKNEQENLPLGDALLDTRKIADRLSDMTTLQLSDLKDELDKQLTDLLDKGKGESFDGPTKKDIKGTFHLLQMTRQEHGKAPARDNASIQISGLQNATSVDYRPTLLSPFLRNADLRSLLPRKNDAANPLSEESIAFLDKLPQLKALELEERQSRLKEDLTNLLKKGEPSNEEEKKNIAETFHLLQMTRKAYREALGMTAAKAMVSREAAGPRSSYSNAADYLLAQEEGETAGVNNAGAANKFPKGRRASLVTQWKKEARNAAIDRLDGINTRRLPDQARIAELEQMYGVNSSKIPRINTGRLFRPCTWNELGVGGIIDRYCSRIPDATAQDPSPSRLYAKGINPDEPMLLRNTVSLKDGNDIARLIADLERSHSPFHVISLPGTTDGTYERSYVFTKFPKANNPAESTWFMLPEIGNAAAANLHPLGQAKNIEQPPPLTLDFHEHPDASRGRPFTKERTESLSRPSANAGPMETGVGNSGLPPVQHTLQSFLKNLVNQGLEYQGEARLSVMSPMTPAMKSHIAGIKYMGYDVDYLEVDDSMLEMTRSLQGIGCDIRSDQFDDDDRMQLGQGLYDESEGALILAVYTTGNNPNLFVAWSDDHRGTGRNLVTGESYGGKPSDFWNEAQSRQVPVASVSAIFVMPSEAANVTSILTGMDKNDAQLALFRSAREDNAQDMMNDFDVLSHLFIKQNGNAASASFDLGSVDNPKNSDLGPILDSFSGNFMLEFHDDELDENDNPATIRYCFKAPGQQGDGTPTAIATTLADADQKIYPSDLLERTRALDDPDLRTVRILSTEPISSDTLVAEATQAEESTDAHVAVDQSETMNWEEFRHEFIKMEEDDANTVFEFDGQDSMTGLSSASTGKRKAGEMAQEEDNGESSSHPVKRRDSV